MNEAPIHLVNLAPWAVTAILYLLAVLDCGYASYRCAGGKNALIRKDRYYARALLKGALWSNLPVAIAAALIAAVTSMRVESLLLLTEAGRYALDIYLPYALIVLLSLGLRFIPDADVRAVTQTVVLGPFTFARPAVAFLGLANAFWHLQDPLVFVVGAIVLTMMLLAEPLFERLNRYPQFQHIAK
jgi:hypothetical protein